jgi:hypothetical protein
MSQPTIPLVTKVASHCEPAVQAYSPAICRLCKIEVCGGFKHYLPLCEKCWRSGDDLNAARTRSKFNPINNTVLIADILP